MHGLGASALVNQPRWENLLAASLDRIRKTMSVRPTARDKGLALTLRLVAYDNGMIEVDGFPINEAPEYDAAIGWLGPGEVSVATINEFWR